MRKKLLIFVFLFCALLPTAYAADKLTALWVTQDAYTDSLPTDAIEWYKPDNGTAYYLFLPSYADAASLHVYFSGAEKITIGETEYQSGDVCSGFVPNETVQVRCGSKKYTVCIMQSASLPAIFITTESGKLDYIHRKKGNEETGNVMIKTEYGAVQTAQALTQIKARGNSSFQFRKKNYQIKLENGTDLFNMGKCKTWILTGNYRDKSLLRNYITYRIAAYVGMQYMPEVVFADVYINHEYMGNYLFGEKVQIDESRIDIFDLEEATEKSNDEPLKNYALIGKKDPSTENGKYYDIPNDPDDITGGYLMELESYQSRYGEEKTAYMTTHKRILVIKSPEYCTKMQYEYITTFMQGFENSIFSEDGFDPVSKWHYTEFFDMESLVLKYMIEEVVKNYDANTSSQFFYKPADSQSRLAFAGPVWDYDSAFAAYATQRNKSLLSPDGFYANIGTQNSWWRALYSHDDFKQCVMQAWRERFYPACSVLLGEQKDDTGTLLSLAEYQAFLAPSAAMNFVRWPIVKSTAIVAQTGYTFDENITFLQDYITARRAFLETEWGK